MVSGDQSKIRTAVDKSSKLSSEELERQLAFKNAEIERLKGQNELLIASHKTMILAVTEMGGFPMWKRFFERYQTALDVLEGMGAIPGTGMVQFTSREKP